MSTWINNPYYCVDSDIDYNVDVDVVDHVTDEQFADSLQINKFMLRSIFHLKFSYLTI